MIPRNPRFESVTFTLGMPRGLVHQLAMKKHPKFDKIALSGPIKNRSYGFYKPAFWGIQAVM